MYRLFELSNPLFGSRSDPTSLSVSASGENGAVPLVRSM